MAKAALRGKFEAINILVRKQMSLAQGARGKKKTQQHTRHKKDVRKQIGQSSIKLRPNRDKEHN